MNIHLYYILYKSICTYTVLKEILLNFRCNTFAVSLIAYIAPHNILFFLSLDRLAAVSLTLPAVCAPSGYTRCAFGHPGGLYRLEGLLIIVSFISPRWCTHTCTQTCTLIETHTCELACINVCFNRGYFSNRQTLFQLLQLYTDTHTNKHT